MPRIIGVKFRDAGKVYFFDPGENNIRYHDHVIVETARGIEYGTVVISPTEITEDRVTQPLRGVIRMATAEDDAAEKDNRIREKEAYRICKQKILEHELEMKLIEAEYTFDNTKLLFYFTADGRIDFRDLVKDLASIFRTRIELRQIGVRDETKLLGGIGSCGRALCCHTWLSEFAPVSIKMAKDQNLSLNPTKISGTCGRLMCCLKNEADTYASLNKGMPGKGDYVTTPEGLHGDVQSVNILRQTVKVIVDLENDEKELREFPVSEITFIPKAKRQKMLQEAKAEAGKHPAKPAEEEKPKEEISEAQEEQEDPDLIWTPRMDNFDARDYILKEENPGKKSRERRKRGGKGHEGQGEDLSENTYGRERSAGGRDGYSGKDKARGEKKDRNAGRDKDGGEKKDHSGAGGKEKAGAEGKERYGAGGKEKAGAEGKEKAGAEGKERYGGGGKEKAGAEGKERHGAGGKEKAGGRYKSGGKDKSGNAGKDKSGTGGKDKSGGEGRDRSGGDGRDKSGGDGKDKSGGEGRDRSGGDGKDKSGGEGRDRSGADGKDHRYNRHRRRTGHPRNNTDGKESPSDHRNNPDGGGYAET